MEQAMLQITRRAVHSHMCTNIDSLRIAARAIAVGFATLGAGLVSTQVSAQDRSPWPVDAWRTSTFHRAQNADGKIIPCRCVFKGREYRVGEIVCMATHLGVVFTRCDLSLNNTTWVPSDSPCDVSTIAPMTRFAAR
jgi:hypothetical protein